MQERVSTANARRGLFEAIPDRWTRTWSRMHHRKDHGPLVQITVQVRVGLRVTVNGMHEEHAIALNA